MELYQVILGLIIVLLVWYFSALWPNIVAARKTGLPMVISPVDPDTPVWLVISAMFQPQIEAYLPAFMYNWVRLSIFGWEFRERWSSRIEKLGKSFIIVTPGKNTVWTSDPQAMNQVLSRRNDYLQLELASKMLGVFGMSLTASDGETWQRHRKATAPILNERIMAAVWKDTREQTQGMLDEFTGRGHDTSGGTNEVIEGIRIVAINVIGSIVYGNHSSWSETFKRSGTSAGHTLTFIEAMSNVVNNLIVAALVPARYLCYGWMPGSVQKLGISITEFPQYAKEFIEEQRTKNETSNTLLGNLVRYADQHQMDDQSIKSSLYLSEDEMIGNLFNFTVAGFDTTATTTTYALLALTLEPQWQDWLMEEIDQLRSSNSVVNHDTAFPSMKRCLAIMYETLRLYTPVMHSTRRIVQAQTTPFRIFPGTSIFITPSLTHVCPEYYGPDPLTYRPSRWIQDGSIIEVPKGTFLPWSGGPRHCPGSKMSQVEFVAILFQIFSNWRLEIAERNGETKDQARDRLLGLIKDSQPKVTQQLRNPGDVWLRFVKR